MRRTSRVAVCLARFTGRLPIAPSKFLVGLVDEARVVTAPVGVDRLVEVEVKLVVSKALVVDLAAPVRLVLRDDVADILCTQAGQRGKSAGAQST